MQKGVCNQRRCRSEKRGCLREMIRLRGIHEMPLAPREKDKGGYSGLGLDAKRMEGAQQKNRYRRASLMEMRSGVRQNANRYKKEGGGKKKTTGSLPMEALSADLRDCRGRKNIGAKHNTPGGGKRDI